MATSKKTGGNAKSPSRGAAGKADAGKAKPARGRGSRPKAAEPAPVEVTVAEVEITEVTAVGVTPAVGRVVRPRVEPASAVPAPIEPPEPVPGLDAVRAVVRELSGDISAVMKELRDAAEEVRALRAEKNAVRKELGELRDQIKAVGKEAAAGTAGLERLRAEAQAAVAHVADLKHACREAGEELRTEVGEDSVVLVRLRQAREQADEAVREATGAGERIRAFREECEKAAKAADVLHLQARAAYLESLNEVLKGITRVKNEMYGLGDSLGELREEAERPVAPRPAVESGNRLGVAVDPGVVVAEVLPDGMAAAAGLARGDVIESVNGTEVHGAAGLRDAVLSVPNGAELTVRIRRAGDPLLMVGRVGPAGEDGNRLGVVVAPGVVVAGVTDGSPADAAGLARGDVIEKADGQDVRSGEDLRTAVQTHPPGAEVTLAVARGSEVREVVVRLDRGAGAEGEEGRE